MQVPYVYVTYCDENPASGRWDQAWVQRILDQEEWRPPGSPELYEFDPERGDPAGPMDGCVIVFPCGHYAEHCSVWPALQKLQNLVDKLPWSVVIATSDEGSTFPWHRFEIPNNCQLWVMTPRPEKEYPAGTFFIGEGSPYSAAEFAADAAPHWEKDDDLYFIGQINHERREQMYEAIQKLNHSAFGPVAQWTCDVTAGFAQGISPKDYRRLMTRARVVPAPSGPLTQDSFRFYEALEAQAIPIADLLRPESEEYGYWKMLFHDSQIPAVSDWEEELLYIMQQPVRLDTLLPAKVSAWWQQHKRNVAYRLVDDIRDVTPTAVMETASDKITVLMVTSPSPLHPSVDIIMETIHSVRERLPNAEILIGIDGLRPKDQHRAAAYHEYARRLCAEVNPMRNVCPFVFEEHLHQSGMINKLLAETYTDFVLFVEHDTPLCGEIDFDECIDMMDEHGLSILRFTHEAGVLPEHAHLFLETTPTPGTQFVRTIQYSARPHLIRTNKLRDLVAIFFGSKSKTFLEDTLYGALQYLPEKPNTTPLDGRARTKALWRLHRMAVYAPLGSWKRSEHLDGRRGEPKQPTWIEYDGERPPGAPPEGVFRV